MKERAWSAGLPSSAEKDQLISDFKTFMTTGAKRVVAQPIKNEMKNQFSLIIYFEIDIQSWKK